MRLSRLGISLRKYRCRLGCDPFHPQGGAGLASFEVVSIELFPLQQLSDCSRLDRHFLKFEMEQFCIDGAISG
jgi:hypothetical protein